MARPRTADKRRRILDAAVHVFARKGYFAARVSDIAKKAGVADGTIYLYFENKEDILVRLFDEVMSEHVEAGARGGARPPVGPGAPARRRRAPPRASWARTATWRSSSRWSCASRPTSWSASPPPGSATTSRCSTR